MATTAPTTDVPVFWLSMVYACDAVDCDYETTFLLEEGCEGPRDGAEQTFKLPRLLRRQTGEESRPWPTTKAGRLVVPVPMIAGACPACNTNGRGRWQDGRFGRMRRGFLIHVRWNEECELDPRPVGVPEQAHFRYPDRVGPQHLDACGVPTYAGR